MKLIPIRVFDDNDFSFSDSTFKGIIEQCSKHTRDNYSALGYEGVNIVMHKVLDLNIFETYAENCKKGLDGISIFDFHFKTVRGTDCIPFITQLLDMNLEIKWPEWKSDLSKNPGYVLACLAAVSENNSADIYIGTTSSNLRSNNCQKRLMNLLRIKQDNCALDMGILHYHENPLIDKLKHLIDSYIEKRQQPPPEQAIKEFFEWRLTDPTATTSALHDLDGADLPKFKKHNAYKALRGLLRLKDLELDEVLRSDGCQRALLEALKGMGANDDKTINQQCSTFGLFLIAWSAFRVKNALSNFFKDALKSFSKDWETCKDVAKSHPVTQGVNSTSAVLSAFFLFLELATDHDNHTTNQIECVSLNQFGFEIGFKFVANGFGNFKRTVEKEFSIMHASFERNGQTSTSSPGSLTSKALIHLMMEVGCRQALFGGDQRAEMSVQWKDSCQILLIKFAPRKV